MQPSAHDPAMRSEADGEPHLPNAWPEPWVQLEWSLLDTGRRSKDRVYLATGPEGELIGKDASEARGRGPAAWIRRWTHRNEVSALKALADVPGIPQLVADWDTGLIMQRVAGRPLREFLSKTVPPHAFDKVDAILDGIHRSGRVVIDVHRKNILVSDDGQVHMVDFELAIPVDRGRWSLLRRPLQAMDRTCAARLRQRYGVALDERHHEALGTGRMRVYRFLHQLKKLQRRLTRKT